MILKRNIPLSLYSNIKIGGTAKYFYEFKSQGDLISALSEYKKIDPSINSIFILGKGTNVLFSDEGFDGLVLKNDYIGIEHEYNQVLVNSGTQMDELVNFSISNTLSGFEWAGGLPGTVGGAIRGNAGAFGGEIRDNLIEATSISLNDLKTKVRSNSECKFDYRQSVFKNNAANEIILSSKFAVKIASQAEIKSSTEEKIEYRKLKHPLEFPNIGSTFKNIPVERVPGDVLEEFKNYVKNDPFPVLPVAKLIACAELMGKRIGDAEVSRKHPNFIVNLGKAKSKEVLDLIDMIKSKIKNKYRIELEEEIRII